MKLRGVAIPLLFLCFAAAPDAHASVEFRHESFSTKVRNAGVIFAGTVSELETLRVDAGSVIRVMFRDVDYAKGHPLPGGSTRLTVRGGGGLYYFGMPSFVVGRRYVALAAEDMGSSENWYLPILSRSLYSVATDSTLGQPVVKISDWPIARVEGEELVLASHDPMDEDYSLRMSEQDFLDVIRTILKGR